MTKRHPFQILLLVLLFWLPLALQAQTTRASLDGEWLFALDPVDAGVQQEWFKPGLPTDKWDKVSVPHCFTIDPRYHYFTGNAWYLKRFPAVTRTAGVHTFVHFEAVFYRAQVWLNGKLVGEHEGGYTPFEFEVTDLLTDDNLLAIRVNNAWSTTTIPGAKTKVDYQSLNYGQQYPWMNYGGITRETSLVTRPELYLEKLKIEAVPDLVEKTATVTVHAFVQNRSSQAWNGKDLDFALYREGKKIPLEFKIAGQDVAPHSNAILKINAALAKADVHLWSFDEPILYEAEVTAGKDVAKASFGIRSVAVQGTKLLLNGEPISLGGCNRPLDFPGHGSMDPSSILERDMQLIKSGGMELSRIAHYPVSRQLLDWADQHGMLIIAEAGNWQMTPEQMADPAMREKFRAQMREMIERDWNHPSVIAWSTGNEYQSRTEEGKSWTKDMAAFARSLDASRLITFASHSVFRAGIKGPEEEASQYVDFISANIYGSHLENLQRIHALYPNKPVYVSEFGIRADTVANEEERVAYLKRAMADFRQCSDFLIGASVWTFNDYESMFPGSNANGYRPWGLVRPDRSPRAMYYGWKTEFSPATVETRRVGSDQLEVTVVARNDFPRYTLRNYQLKVGDQVLEVPPLAPGERKTFVIEHAADVSSPHLQLLKPGGFVILDSNH